MKKKMNKEIEYYMNMPYTIEMIPEEDGYFVSIKELPGCMSQGDTKEEALANIEEAKYLWIETALKRNISIPEPDNEEKYSGRLLLRIPKSLHKQLSRYAEKEGMSLNALINNLISKNFSYLEIKNEIKEELLEEIEFHPYKEQKLTIKDFYGNNIKIKYPNPKKGAS